MNRVTYRTVLRNVWPTVRRRFNYPLIDRVRLFGEGTDTDDSMAYRWNRNELVVSPIFIEWLDPVDSADLEDLFRAVLTHELGHYTYFPREISNHLLFLRRAVETFGEDRGYRLYSMYSNVCNELRLLNSGFDSGDVLMLRHRTLRAFESQEGGSPDSTVGRRITRLYLGLYDELFEGIYSDVDLMDDEREVVADLTGIDFFTEDPRRHEYNIVKFGRILDTILPSMNDPSIFASAPEDTGKLGVGAPVIGNILGQIPEAELDEALSETLETHGKWTYELLKEFLERNSTYVDPYEHGDFGGAAGIDRAGFERNDSEIPFYRRWASQFPLYLAETPMRTDDTALYRSGRKPYESGDPITRTNLFGSRGQVGIPGISQIDQFEEGTVPLETRGIPDLLVGIDSSGSMPHPANESPAVLAAFILGDTYHRNGVRVGGYNFSAEIAFLPPSRDLDRLQSLVCGYWGGGTLIDNETLTRLIADLETVTGIQFSDDDDYARSIDRLPIDIPDRTDGRSTDISHAAVVKQFERIDHVLITDGAIMNRESVIEFVDEYGTTARHFVFLTDEINYEEWVDLEIENMWVYRAGSTAALVDLVIGRARDLVSELDTINDPLRH